MNNPIQFDRTNCPSFLQLFNNQLLTLIFTKNSLIFFISVILGFLSICGTAYSQGQNNVLMRNHYFEVRANFINKNSLHFGTTYGAIKLPHVEIPLDFVEKNIGEIDKQVLSSLIFYKEGKPFVRWILSPNYSADMLETGEPTKVYKYPLSMNTEFSMYKPEASDKILAYFKSKRLNPEVKFYYNGYATASRTFIVEDPETKINFYAKLSTGRNDLQNKHLHVPEIRISRAVSDLLTSVRKQNDFKYFTFFEENAGFMLPEIDQGLLIRDTAEMKSKDSRFLYLPAFSALHSEVGKQVAKANGSDNPFEFWTKNFSKIIGRAMGELSARTGMASDSPHSQNYLFEMDTNMKLTGRLVFRDLGDMNILEIYYSKFEKEFGLNRKDWESQITPTKSESPPTGFNEYYPHHLAFQQAKFNPFWYGGSNDFYDENHLWIGGKYSRNIMDTWGPIFQNNFEESFLEFSKVDLKKMGKTNGGLWPVGSGTIHGWVTSYAIDLENPIFKTHLESLGAHNSINACKDLFKFK